MPTDRENAFKQRLLAAFKIEAAEHISTISSGLIRLEQNDLAQTDSTQSDLDRSENPAHDSKEITETIFRATHSLKGAARAVDMADIESICKALENIFAVWKRDQKKWLAAREHFKVIYSAVDTIADALASDNHEGFNFSKLIENLDRVTTDLDKPSGTLSGKPAGTASDKLEADVSDNSATTVTEKPVATASEKPATAVTEKPDPQLLHLIKSLIKKEFNLTKR
ncbi:MAG: Hpt domain-containing protein [Desulfamplus sp.]|nr:Hpt domain-containing protein [Desulfamplus sp.]